MILSLSDRDQKNIPTPTRLKLYRVPQRPWGKFPACVCANLCKIYDSSVEAV
jgi:hypothetical protein